MCDFLPIRILQWKAGDCINIWLTHDFMCYANFYCIPDEDMFWYRTLQTGSVDIYDTWLCKNFKFVFRLLYVLLLISWSTCN